MAELNYAQDDFQERFAEFHRRGFQLEQLNVFFKE
jgi:hypothetical protein